MWDELNEVPMILRRDSLGIQVLFSIMDVLSIHLVKDIWFRLHKIHFQ